MKTNKWIKLLESVSPSLILAYEKNVGVDLEKEVQLVAKIEKKNEVLEICKMLLIMIIFICWIILFNNHWFTVGILYSVSMGLTALFLAVVPVPFMKKDNSIKATALKKLEAFEKVIEALDPADLNSQPIRDAWILDWSDIKQNLAKLARKVLLAQSELDFYRSCAYAKSYDVEFVQKKANDLSERLSTCLKLLPNLGIEHSRLEAILEAKKLSAVKF